MSNGTTYSAGIVTAYGAAKKAGYTGTYSEFCAAMEALANATAQAETLAEGESATASYEDGLFSFGIPTGPTGATGDTGPTGNGIAKIEKTGTSGYVDTYTITYTNGNTTTFTVTNGLDGSAGFNAEYDSTKKEIILTWMTE